MVETSGKMMRGFIHRERRLEPIQGPFVRPLEQRGIRLYRIDLAGQPFNLVVRHGIAESSRAWKRERHFLMKLSRPGHPGLPLILRFTCVHNQPATLEDGRSFIPLTQLVESIPYLPGMERQMFRIPPPFVGHILVRLVDILRYLHHRKVVSRSVHPSLLGFSQTNFRFITLTHARNEADVDLTMVQTTDKKVAVDYDAWTPPEILSVLRGHSAFEPAWDIWSVGVLGYYLLTGKVCLDRRKPAPGITLPDYREDAIERRFDRLARMAENWGGGCRELVAFMRQSVAFNPAERPSAEQLYWDLMNWDIRYGPRYASVELMIRRLSGAVSGPREDVLWSLMLDRMNGQPPDEEIGRTGKTVLKRVSPKNSGRKSRWVFFFWRKRNGTGVSPTG